MKTDVIAILLSTVALFSFFSGKKETTAKTPAALVERRIAVQADSFSSLVNKLKLEAKSGIASEQKLKQLFLQTRLAYKKFEWAAEYFTPDITRFVNGAPVPEVEMGGQQVYEPQGLQVIETILYPHYHPSKKKELLKYLQMLQAKCRNLTLYFNTVPISDWQIYDAARQQIFRVITLGITGFDDPLSFNSMRESGASLQSLQAIVSVYPAQESTAGLLKELSAADNYLLQNTGFNTFNRAYFITAYGNRISAGFSSLQKELKLPVVKYNRLLNQDAATLFDKNAFNINAYGTDLDAVTEEKIALGKKLFFDPLLSGTGTRSCATCHQPERAFTDGLMKNTVINGTTLLRRNTPSLINAALQPAQFYDLRVNTLEDQVINVMQNKDEMHGSVSKTISRLQEDKVYRQLFSVAYPKNGKEIIDTVEFTNAIASYVRSLTLLNSRFDQYMQGNHTAMTRQEINGFNLFMGKAKCGTCHYMPLFNGTLPPKFLKTESEVIGVPATRSAKTLDPDLGQFDIIPVEAYKHAFKTPTIRNAAKTAPYMHNGVFGDLKQVVDFYNKGGGAGAGLKVDNQTLPVDHLHLSNKEKDALIAFMKSLDSQMPEN